MARKTGLIGFLLAAVVASFMWLNIAAAASWELDNSLSQLNFVSIKKGSVAEVHSFTALSGSVNEQGSFEVVIDLTSVDTNNAIRDDRMLEFLFQVASFATATISGTFPADTLKAIAEGSNSYLSIDAEVNLHGQKQILPVELVITRLVDAKISVMSVQPVVLNIVDFGLDDGVTKLMELAKLPSISRAVPVTFALTFNFAP